MEKSPVIAALQREQADIATEDGDIGTADLFTRLVQVHQKQRWFLKEIRPQGALIRGGAAPWGTCRRAPSGAWRHAAWAGPPALPGCGRRAQWGQTSVDCAPAPA